MPPRRPLAAWRLTAILFICFGRTIFHTSLSTCFTAIQAKGISNQFSGIVARDTVAEPATHILVSAHLPFSARRLLKKRRQFPRHRIGCAKMQQQFRHHTVAYNKIRERHIFNFQQFLHYAICEFPSVAAIAHNLRSAYKGGLKSSGAGSHNCGLRIFQKSRRSPEHHLQTGSWAISL